MGVITENVKRMTHVGAIDTLLKGKKKIQQRIFAGEDPVELMPSIQS